MTDPWCWYINANIKEVYWWDPWHTIYSMDPMGMGKHWVRDRSHLPYAQTRTGTYHRVIDFSVDPLGRRTFPGAIHAVMDHMLFSDMLSHARAYGVIWDFGNTANPHRRHSFGMSASHSMHWDHRSYRSHLWKLLISRWFMSLAETSGRGSHQNWHFL